MNNFIRRNFTAMQFRAMRWQIERAEEQCIRSGRRVTWMIEFTEL